MNQNVELARIQQQAADWLIRFSEDEEGVERDAALQAEWQQWCQQDARHERVYRQMHQLWTSATQTPAATGRKHRSLHALSVALLLGLGLMATQLPYRYWLADQRTATGEVRRLMLDDGSTLTLNTHSAVNIRFDGSQRLIELVTGEVYAQVAKDPGRPFVMRSAQASAQALGTRYSMREIDDETRVHVEESHVRVTAQDNPAINVELTAGQQVSLNQQRVIQAVQSGVPDAGWLHNQLIFEDAPLGEVINELARYHRGAIYLDPRHRAALNDMRFTGVLPLNNTRSALSLLSHALPLTYRQPFDALVLISSK